MIKQKSSRRIATVLVLVCVSPALTGLDKQTGGLAGADEAQNKKRKRNPVDRMPGKLHSREIALLRGKNARVGGGKNGKGREAR